MEYDKCKDSLNGANNNESWKEEVEAKNQRIVYLEQQLKHCEDLKNNAKHGRANNNVETQTRTYEKCWCLDTKTRQIFAMEQQIAASLSKFSKNHTKKTTVSFEKDNDAEMSGETEESWKQEIETKNRRIVELEQEIASLENLLRENVDAQRLHDLEKTNSRKSRRIEELEDAVEELEDFLKKDVKEMRDLRYQVSLDKERIIALEKWIQKINLTNRKIDKGRIIELEEMVTSLEDYVKEHDIDGLKRKLQDRESKIDQLQNQIVELDGIMRSMKSQLVKDTSKKNDMFKDGMNWDLQEKGQKIKETAISEEDNKIQEWKQEIVEQRDEILKMELREKEQKMMEMGHDISEKDNRIQEYEQQSVEQQNTLLKMEKEMDELEKEFHIKVKDISVLKEEIRVKSERVQELEEEVNSLETSFGDRIEIAIEELSSTMKEKEEIQHQWKEDFKNKIEELNAALRESIAITNETERKYKLEQKLRKEADHKIAELDERIADMHTASAIKCITCQPLLYKIIKVEEKLVRSNQEKLQELHQIKREALKATLSEKDAHLALLEHSGIKTPMQADQAEKLKADKKILLDRLREEDERSIKLDVEWDKTELFRKILQISDESKDSSDNNNNSFDDCLSKISSWRSTIMSGDSSSISATTSCEHQ